LPAIYEWKQFTQSGGLISYGADIPDIYRRAAGLADKILRGAKPTDLPVETPKQVEIAVNLKSAKALGVTVPDSILKQAVQIIE
jgi:putative tryptophan/tyrosine transport system substrate-binding protein